MARKTPKFIFFLLCFLLIFEQSGFAQIAGSLDISGHLAALHSAFTPDVFRPLHLRYLSYNPIENNFQLFLDKGSLKDPSKQELQDTTKTLLNYFFIGISLPNNSFWVNLRPDAEDNIIDDRLAQTDIGRIMLETDLQLKKDTAAFTSPQTPEGREYWDKLYKKAGEIFGSQNITIPTLTRPWIVPDEIIIRETAGEASGTERSRSAPSAYIYKATLKVMLEQDYLKDSAVYNFKDERLKELNEYSSQLIRELIIPKLTKEVNSSKRYASLRQVYYSLIMAQWFKARFNQPSSLRGEAEAISSRINSNDLTNLTSKEDWSKTTYFQAYQKSFKDGEYNIREPVHSIYGQKIRSYFSGGMQLMPTQKDLAPFGEPKLVSSPVLALPAVGSSPIISGPEKWTRLIPILVLSGGVLLIQGDTPHPFAEKVAITKADNQIANLQLRAKNGNEAALTALVQLASQGNNDAVLSLDRIASDGNSAAKEALRTLDTTKFVQLASQGNNYAVLSLDLIASDGNSAAKEALRTLDTTKFVQLASQGDQEAVERLASFASRGNSAAKEALRTLDTTKFVQLASQGDQEAVERLADFASRGNSAAFNALVTLASQGNSEAVWRLVDLASRGNSAAKEALRTLDTTKFVQLASQGDRKAVLSLGRIASQRNSAAFNALVTLVSQGNNEAVLSLGYVAFKGNSAAFNVLVTLAPQGNNDAVLNLDRIASDGNSAAKEALRTLDTTKFVQLASQGDQEAVESLGRIAVYNYKAFDILLEMLTTHKVIQDTLENVLRNYISLPIVRKINDLHNSQDDIRFASVSTAQAKLLYALMVYGQEEIFTSSFNGLFNRLLERMQKEGLSGEQLLAKVNYNKFRIFIKLGANFNRLNEFLDTLNTPEARKQFIQSFVKDLDKTKDPLGEAVVVADMFGIIQDKNILAILQETVRSEYERVVRENKKEAKALYGLLAGMFSQKAVINIEWLQEMAKKYQLANILEIPQSALVDAQGRHIEQYFFYDDPEDKDGEASFRNFISTFKNGNWRLEDTPHYVILKSISGTSVAIYANKPQFKEKGQEEISQFFKERNLKPQVIVHRGHSTHTMETIKRIGPNTQLVYLGSCGGYNNVKAVLDKSSATHILSTKGVGTMVVNDPLLRAIAEHIRQGQGLNWTRFKKEAETALGRNGAFRNYIFPPDNLGVMFFKAYKRILEQEKAPRSGAKGSSPITEENSASSPVIEAQFASSAVEGKAELIDAYIRKIEAMGGKPTKKRIEEVIFGGPEYLLDEVPGQKDLLKSMQPLQFSPGVLYHGNPDVDGAIRSRGILRGAGIWGEADTARIVFTRAGQQYPLELRQEEKSSPGIFVIRTEVFNSYLKTDKADMGLLTVDRKSGNAEHISPSIEAPLPLSDIWEIWVSETTFKRYQDIAGGKIAVEAEFQENLRALLNEGKIIGVPGLEDTHLYGRRLRGKIKIISHYLIERGLLLQIPYFVETTTARSSTEAQSASSAVGGIDFRSLPIVTQAVTNLNAVLRDSHLRGESLLKVNLNDEWLQIERMANSGITPSSERIKEYIQSSCAQDNITQDKDKILLCISDILRIQEESCAPTDDTLRDILVVLESMGNAQELKEVFLGASPA